MARVLKGSHSFTRTPTRSSTIGMSHTCLCLPAFLQYCGCYSTPHSQGNCTNILHLCKTPVTMPRSHLTFVIMRAYVVSLSRSFSSRSMNVSLLVLTSNLSLVHRTPDTLHTHSHLTQCLHPALRDLFLEQPSRQYLCGNKCSEDLISCSSSWLTAITLD